MKPLFLNKSLSITLASVAVLGLVGTPGVGAEPETEGSPTKPSGDGGQEETIRSIPKWAAWQKEVVEFDAMLRKLIETADVPEAEDLKKRLESESGWVEVITDGYGGVVDFNAAEGTIQYEASNLVGPGGPYIDWEFELASDAKINYDKSTGFVPKIARIADDGEEKGERFRFFISIAETDDGPFKVRDRIRLRASVDDFSRFKKRYHKATGLVAIYYLEDAPNPVFDLRLDEAEVTLIERANQNGGEGEAAKPEEPVDGDAREN